ncbi:MAG: hypothetical protein IJK66_01295 [Bacilli bacterium]|nr:hypothetical protein [Bacilli bacterium]
MRLLDRFKKWFFNETKLDIISIADLIQIPGRDYYADEPNKLDLIDRYKEEYLKILSQRKRLTTKDISCDNLVESNKMYIDLILRLVMKDDFYDIENQSLLDNKIMISKLKIYLDEIVKIEDEVIERLIALSELEKGRRVPHLNRSTLKSEIDNLKVTLQILISQKTSIRNEIDSYLTHISISDNRVSPKAIEGRRDKTIRYASHIINVNRIFNEDELTDNNIYKQISIIAILETEMEKELYINRPNIAHIISRANEIKNAANLNYDETRLMKCKLLHDLDGLENELMLYDLFGKNLVTYEDWYKFYIAKFRILTFDIADNYNDWELEKRLFVYPNEIERKVYEDIIYKKKLKITDGKNSLFEQAIRLDDNTFKSSTYLAFLKYLKKDIDYYEYYANNKHHSIEAIRLLLSFDSFFNFLRLLNRKININSLPDNICFEEIKNKKANFVFCDMVPLSTILEVINYTDLPNYYKFLKDVYVRFKNIFGSYFFLDRKISKDYYLLPEGIEEIHKSYSVYDTYYMQKVREEAKSKILVMPNSLKVIQGDLCSTKYVKSSILNEGLKEIGCYAYVRWSSVIFNIPSSLEKCESGCIDCSNIKTLRFKDYKNSKLLFNEKQLANLIYSSLCCKSLSFKNKKVNYNHNKVETKIDAVVRVFSNVKNIILEENGVDVIIINVGELNYHGTLKGNNYKEAYYKLNYKLALKYTEALIRKIKSEIDKYELEKDAKVLRKG